MTSGARGTLEERWAGLRGLTWEVVNCVGGEGAVRVLQGFGARDHRRQQREELQSPSGPLSLEGLRRVRDRLPAGVGAGFSKACSVGCVPKEAFGHTILGGKTSVISALELLTGQVCALALLIVYPAKC